MLRDFFGGDKKDGDNKSGNNKDGSSASGLDDDDEGVQFDSKTKKGVAPGMTAEQRREEAAKRESRLREEPAVRTSEHDEQRHTEKYKAKLREAALGSGGRRGPPGGGGVTYDGLMRPASRVMPLDPQSGIDFHDGLVLSTTRMVQNMQLGSKWTVGNPQHSNWEFSLGTHGFSENSSVSYTTGGRWALMHQRVFRTGAVGMLQFMLNPQMGQMSKTFVAMLMYPWGPHGGTTQVQYVQNQQAQISHAARLVRGVDVGAALTYEFMTNSTHVSYAFHTTSADKSRNWCGSWTPETGAWKLALTKFDWASDLECGAQIELADKRGQLTPGFALGIRKPLFGGGLVHCILSNFSKLKAFVELPFGGDRQGMNQVNFKWLVQYDAVSGGAKHGVTIGF